MSYYPIDVSRSALEHCQRELSGEAQVHPIEATFVEGVRTALAGIPRDHTALLLFLGSTIGNFDRPAASELLSQLRSTLGEGDLMLIGADLVKPVETLIRAYDDPAGVTSAFNLNLLARINRELGADFDLRQFRHQARYDAKLQRIEMHLVARGSQRVAIPAADCDVHFAAGESIWTEVVMQVRSSGDWTLWPKAADSECWKLGRIASGRSLRASGRRSRIVRLPAEEEVYFLVAGEAGGRAWAQWVRESRV